MLTTPYRRLLPARHEAQDCHLAGPQADAQGRGAAERVSHRVCCSDAAVPLRVLAVSPPSLRFSIFCFLTLPPFFSPGSFSNDAEAWQQLVDIYVADFEYDADTSPWLQHVTPRPLSFVRAPTAALTTLPHLPASSLAWRALRLPWRSSSCSTRTTTSTTPSTPR